MLFWVGLATGRRCGTFVKKVILDGGLVFRIGWVGVVTIYRVVIKRECVVV